MRNTIALQAHVEKNDDYEGGYRIGITVVLTTMTSDGPWRREVSCHYLYRNEQIAPAYTTPVFPTWAGSHFYGIGILVGGVAFCGPDYNPEDGTTFELPPALKREIKRLQSERDCDLVVSFF